MELVKLQQQNMILVGSPEEIIDLNPNLQDDEVLIGW